MQCPKCSGFFAVVETRPGTSESPVKLGHETQQWGRDVVGWWNPSDFVARLRRCRACGHQQRTIEILEEDVPTLIVRDPDAGASSD